jgi:hypothetical protein
MRPLAVLSILAIIGPMACAPARALGPSLPVPNPLSLSLDSSTQEAIVTWSQGCDVLFTGNVTVQLVPGQKMVASLEAELDTYWNVSIEPAEMNFTGSGKQNFTANASVPAGALASIAAVLVITVRTTVASLPLIKDVNATITVKPYYLLQIETEEAFADIQPGGQAGFKLKVYNYGNAQDTFDLKVSDKPAPNLPGWEIRLNTTVVENVPACEYREVQITVNSPRDWDWTLKRQDTFIFSITATSRGAAGQGASATSQKFPFYVYESGFNMPVLAILMAAITAVLSSLAVAGFVIMKRLRRRRLRKMRLKKDGGFTG